MINSAKNSSWPLDVKIVDLESAGLPSASVARRKILNKTIKKPENIKK